MEFWNIQAQALRVGDEIRAGGIHDETYLIVREKDPVDFRRKDARVRVLLDRGLHMPTEGKFWHTFARDAPLTVRR